MFHALYHRLALARAVKIFRTNLFNFETTTKMLNIYAKTAIKMHDLEALLKNKYKSKKHA